MHCDCVAGEAAVVHWQRRLVRQELGYGFRTLSLRRVRP